MAKTDSFLTKPYFVIAESYKLLMVSLQSNLKTVGGRMKVRKHAASGRSCASYDE